MTWYIIQNLLIRFWRPLLVAGVMLSLGVVLWWQLQSYGAYQFSAGQASERTTQLTLINAWEKRERQLTDTHTQTLATALHKQKATSNAQIATLKQQLATSNLRLVTLDAELVRLYNASTGRPGEPPKSPTAASTADSGTSAATAADLMTVCIANNASFIEVVTRYRDLIQWYDSLKNEHN
jgi:hypothetical protein